MTFKGLLTDVKCKPETKLEPHFSTEMDATCQILLFSIHQLIIGSYVSVHPWGYKGTQGKSCSATPAALKTFQVLHIPMKAQLTYEPIVLE